jgi:hypothetical protein
MRPTTSAFFVWALCQPDFVNSLREHSGRSLERTAVFGQEFEGCGVQRSSEVGRSSPKSGFPRGLPKPTFLAAGRSVESWLHSIGLDFDHDPE